MDTIDDYDNKIDAAVVLRNEVLARAFSDTLARLLTSRTLPSMNGPDDFPILAYAQATKGNVAQARVSLVRMIDAVRKIDRNRFPVNVGSADRVASVYARLGDTRTAIDWLEAGLRSRYTVAWYATHSRLQALRGTPE